MYVCGILGFICNCYQMCVSDQGTIDYTLRMMPITIWIQDPDYDPDHMDRW